MPNKLQFVYNREHRRLTTLTTCTQKHLFQQLPLAHRPIDTPSQKP